MTDIDDEENLDFIKRQSAAAGRDPKTRKILVGLTILLALLMIMTAVAGVLAWKALNRDVATQKDATGVAVGTADTNKGAAIVACQQVETLGGECAVDAQKLDTGKEAVEKVVGKQGIQGIQGVQGVAGVDGVDGLDGQTPSRGLLMTLIRETLAENPPKNGSTGEAGAAGAKGEKGDKGDKGDTGQAGAAGTAGPAGRGIKSLACAGSLTPIEFTVTYDDGTSETFTCGSSDPAP